MAKNLILDPILENGKKVQIHLPKFGPQNFFRRFYLY